MDDESDSPFVNSSSVKKNNQNKLESDSDSDKEVIGVGRGEQKKNNIGVDYVSTLCGEQKDCLEKILDGKNLLVCSSASTEKSYLIKTVIQALRKRNKNVAVTATTGIAAGNLQCGASTLHNWAGAGLCKGKARNEANRILSNTFKTKKWKDVDVLIIDKISMCAPWFFDTLEEMARIISGLLVGCRSFYRGIGHSSRP